MPSYKAGKHKAAPIKNNLLGRKVRKIVNKDNVKALRK